MEEKKDIYPIAIIIFSILGIGFGFALGIFLMGFFSEMGKELVSNQPIQASNGLWYLDGKPLCSNCLKEFGNCTKQLREIKCSEEKQEPVLQESETAEWINQDVNFVNFPMLDFKLDFKNFKGSVHGDY